LGSAATKSSVPDLTSFADIQLNGRVLLQVHAKAKHNQHPTTSGRKSHDDAKPARIQMAKTPNDLVDQFQDLEELYQELLALRMRVRQAERANENRANVSPKKKAGNPGGHKQLAHKRAK
jgi:hypothetical protein